MRFLHLADLHIGKRVNEFSMIEDQRYILNQILDIVKEQEVQCVLIAGDIYDKAVPSAEAAAPATQRATTASRLSSTMAP